MKRTLQLAALAGTLAMGVAIGHAAADQPHMQSALDALKTARGELNAAKDNKGGHRVNALRAVDEAIRETKAGMEFDRKH
jgi:hypothetical protein